MEAELGKITTNPNKNDLLILLTRWANVWIMPILLHPEITTTYQPPPTPTLTPTSTPTHPAPPPPFTHENLMHNSYQQHQQHHWGEDAMHK